MRVSKIFMRFPWVKRGAIDYEARIIVRYLSSGQPLVLMTSLTDRAEHSVDDLLELYRLRWRSEESYKFQKVLLQLDNMHYRSYQVAIQEFWATATLACLMCIRFQEQEELYAKSQGRRRHTVINRSVVFGSLKTFYLRAFLGEISFDEFDKRFIKLCKRHRCSSKPSRHYPRLSVDTRKTRHCHRRHV